MAKRFEESPSRHVVGEDGDLGVERAWYEVGWKNVR